MSERREIVGESSAIEAWHFLPADRRLRWGTREIITPGSVVVVDPPLELCKAGLHASVRAIDALKYGPGPVISRVLVWGEVIRGDDKLCGQYRKCLWMADVSEVLHRFACEAATGALDLLSATGEAVDPRSRKAIEVKLAWLRGEATDEELATARADAGYAAVADAGYAARYAARYAAMAAAMAADRAAAWDAARYAGMAAAMAAARAAASYAAGAVVREEQDRRLADLLMALAPMGAP